MMQGVGRSASPCPKWIEDHAATIPFN